MGLFELSVVLAAWLCSLVAGFLLALAVVVMPGLRTLDDAAFIRSFRAIDGVIQARQPVFLAVWMGAVVMVATAAVAGVGAAGPSERWLLIVAATAYLLGVQVPTFAVHLPLNARIQGVAVESMCDADRAAFRDAFEGRWNRWNIVRTVAACGASLLVTVASTG